MKKLEATALTLFIHLVVTKVQLVAGVSEVMTNAPGFALGWMAASTPMPECPEQLMVKILKGALADPTAVEVCPPFQFRVEEGHEVKGGGVGMG